MFTIRNLSFILIGLYVIITYTCSQHLYTTGTMFPTPGIDPAADCEIINNISIWAFRGRVNQTMKELIVEIATTRWLPHRLEVRSLYEKLHHRDIGGNFLIHFFRPIVGNEVINFFRTPAEIYAHAIYLAMVFFKANNNTLIEIMCCIVDASMDDIAAAYKKERGADMRSDIAKISYGDYRKLLLALTQEKRRGLYPSEPFEKEVFGADNCPWMATILGRLIKIFSKGSYSEIVQYASNLQKKTGRTLEQTLELKAPNDVHSRQLLLKIPLPKPRPKPFTALAPRGLQKNDNRLNRKSWNWKIFVWLSLS